MFLKKHFNMSLLLLLWVFLCLSIPCTMVRGSEEEDKIKFSFPPNDTVKKRISPKSLWKCIETKHTIIQYEMINDLKKFDGKIDYSTGEFTLESLFSASYLKGFKKYLICVEGLERLLLIFIQIKNDYIMPILLLTVQNAIFGPGIYMN